MVIKMLNYTNIELVRTAGLSEQIPRDGIPQIALSGRSNVGKSSFLNKISNRKSLARVSGSPGKTDHAAQFSILSIRSCI